MARVAFPPIMQVSQITSRIHSAIQLVDANTQTVTERSSTNADAARQGSSVARDTLKGMSNIRTKVGVSAEKVREISARSDQIGAIVETNDEIATQTNLLALNAAIQAARAGQQGKGFGQIDCGDVRQPAPCG